METRISIYTKIFQLISPAPLAVPLTSLLIPHEISNDNKNNKKKIDVTEACNSLILT